MVFTVIVMSTTEPEEASGKELGKSSSRAIFMAAAVLVGLYALIIFELCHRTIAAMLGAAAAISCLALVGKCPDLNEGLSRLDIETLSLLFGMMIIVGIFGETGFFDYVAVLAFRLSKGKVWPMITVLCIFTAVISAFLDNVATMLLLTAVTIRLCEVMDLDPKKVLMMLVMFSNVGGSATPIGDPPNVIIISNLKVLASGINFTTSTLHLLPGVILSAFGVYLFLRVTYRDPRSLRKQSRQVVDGQRGTDSWHQARHSSLGKSRGESFELSNVGSKLSQSESNDASDLDFERVLEDLSSKYKIRNRPLLIKSVIDGDVEDRGESEDLNIPIQPLIYALAFGACFGGNGTLIGASANVVCAGVAEHHGYRILFMDFFRVGFPVMVVSTTLASAWLLLTHIGMGWH
ncbi:P protein-like [Galendromus occidentalis]|uniref:P protein-like n=1 Tax=Galendromus occidentalis TaxID=34638 RepID=A0AAJ7L5T7_9ACAR|nr:P protein-like [Galendromus occidentalis]